MKIIDLNNKYWQYATLVVLAIIWGTSFILMKKGLNSYSGVQIASLRMLSAFIVLIPFMPKAIKKIEKKHLPFLLFISLIGNGFTAFLFPFSQKHIDSSVAGMLNATTPILTFMVGVIFYKTKVKNYKILGLIVGLIGVLLLLYFNYTGGVNNNLVYLLLLVLAATFYSFNVNMVKFNLKDLNGTTISIVTFAIVGPVAGVIFFMSDLSTAISSTKIVSSTLYIVILGVFSSALATVIFNVLIKYTSAVFASTVTYLIPIFAVMWGLADGEQVGFFELFSVIFVVAGIYLVNKD